MGQGGSELTAASAVFAVASAGFAAAFAAIFAAALLSFSQSLHTEEKLRWLDGIEKADMGFSCLQRSQILVSPSCSFSSRSV